MAKRDAERKAMLDDKQRQQAEQNELKRLEKEAKIQEARDREEEILNQ